MGHNESGSPMQGAMVAHTAAQYRLCLGVVWPVARAMLQPFLLKTSGQKAAALSSSLARPGHAQAEQQAGKHGSSGRLPHLQPYCCDGAAVAEHQGGELLELCDAVQRLHSGGTGSLHGELMEAPSEKWARRPDHAQQAARRHWQQASSERNWAWDNVQGTRSSLLLLRSIASSGAPVRQPMAR